MNVVGGTSPVTNNVNVVIGASLATDILFSGNKFGNTSASGATSLSNGGGSNNNIATKSNLARANDNQALGSGANTPGAVACGTPLKNTLTNAAELYFAGGGTGVTAIQKNGGTIYTGSGAAPNFSLMLDVGDIMTVQCTTAPQPAWSQANP
jgi:hypothetical protein